MILHILTREKFTQPFIDFINSNFNPNEHLFIVLNKNSKGYRLNAVIRNVYEIEGYDFRVFKLIKSLYISDKIIIHGLNSKIILFILFLQPWLLKKTSWLIWGADLYTYNNRKLTVFDYLYEAIRRFCIKRFSDIIAYAEGDYELAKKWYFTRAKYQKCLYYPYLAVEDYIKINTNMNNAKKIIMVGNSADCSNEHIEIFNIIANIKNLEEYQIFTPLSYGGSTDYIEKVKKIGYQLFGKRFLPLCEFIESDYYYQILSEVRIVVMGHKRQQATGNILALIKFGKKVFIRSNISTWSFYRENGIKVFAYENLKEEILIPLKEDIKIANSNAIKSNFKLKRVVNDWKCIIGQKY